MKKVKKFIALSVALLLMLSLVSMDAFASVKYEKKSTYTDVIANVGDLFYVTTSGVISLERSSITAESGVKVICNTRAALVSEIGLVKANAVGIATITVTDSNGNVLWKYNLRVEADNEGDDNTKPITPTDPVDPITPDAYVETTTDEEGNVIANVSVIASTQVVKVEIPAELGGINGTAFVEITSEAGTTKKTMAVYKDGKVMVKLEGDSTVKVLKTVTGFAITPAFVDIATHWAKENIEATVNLGLFNGKSETSFGPEDPMTREQMWMVLSRLQGEGQATMEGARNWAMGNGVSDGANPKGNVTREQLVTLLWRASGEPKSNYDLSTYSDIANASTWAKDAFAWAVEIGLVNGVTTDTLGAQGTATRAQLATIFNRLVY